MSLTKDSSDETGSRFKSKNAVEPRKDFQVDIPHKTSVNIGKTALNQTTKHMCVIIIKTVRG